MCCYVTFMFLRNINELSFLENTLKLLLAATSFIKTKIFCQLGQVWLNIPINQLRHFIFVVKRVHNCWRTNKLCFALVDT